MTKKTEKVTVQISYKNLKETFCGTTEETWVLTNKFFNEFLPSFETANKLTLSVDLQKLAKDCEGLIAFSTEGPNVLVPKSKLTDNETLLMYLLASYIGNKLGKLENNNLSKDDLQNMLGKSGKIASTRLGELVKNSLLTKTDDEKFRITDFGVTQMQKEVLPKVRAKTNIQP